MRRQGFAWRAVLAAAVILVAGCRDRPAANLVGEWSGSAVVEQELSRSSDGEEIVAVLRFSEEAVFAFEQNGRYTLSTRTRFLRARSLSPDFSEEQISAAAKNTESPTVRHGTYELEGSALTLTCDEEGGGVSLEEQIDVKPDGSIVVQGVEFRRKKP